MDAPRTSAFVVVPVDPTSEMLAAAAGSVTASAIWAAMLAARPSVNEDKNERVIADIRDVRAKLTTAGTDVPSRMLDVLPTLGVTHRNPEFWSDLEVRRLVIETHRYDKIDRVLEIIRSQVGPERTPSRSALGRAWKRLDIAKGNN